ncbi:MAG: UvrB/UvrC motif-containing protein [Oscillospiraceae bacterium]|jgi:protein arginine kinase activator|nr:UvrB/UvrC motif-containing protein [Oscillospiraceae bacterium]
MLCENCKQNQATTHISHTVNGQTQERHLCAKCAAKLGAAPFSGFDISSLLANSLISMEPFGNFTKTLPDLQPQANVAVRCNGCGISFGELAQSGKAGCPECYEIFYDRLLPSLQRIHGKAGHVGRVPAGASQKARNAAELNALKVKLAATVENQEYEEAARLRDQIKTLEANGNEQ